MNKSTKQGFGFLGGALAWLIHIFSTYAIGEGACILKGSLFVFLGLSAAGWLLIGVTLMMIAVCIYSGQVAWKLRKDTHGSVRFLGRVGVISNLFFLFSIIVQASTIPILINGC